MPGDLLTSSCERSGERAGIRSLVLVDSGVAVVVGAGLMFATSRQDAPSVDTLVAILRAVFTVVAAASVATRRVVPTASFGVATASTGVAAAMGAAPMVAVCIAATAYTVAATGRFTLRWAPPVAASAIVAVAVMIGQVRGWVAAIIAGVAVVFVGWFAGQAARERRNRLDALVERQAEHERQHAAELRQAAIDERLVIARELHDIVAHSMSVIAVRAGVARMVMDDDPVEVKETLGIIETTTRQALHEMRLLVAVLRQEDPDGPALAPAPGLADVADLAEQVRRAGVDLRLEIEGPPRPLPPGVDLSAYRIAQEALTNVVRHAGPTRATLRIAYRADDLLIDVTDEGPGASRPRVGTEQRAAGHGLIGMGERVALFDGRLRTGRQGAGFSVEALLRTDESAS